MRPPLDFRQLIVTTPALVFLLLLFSLTLLTFPPTCNGSSSANSIVTQAQPLRDGQRTVVSASGRFVLGFFSPGSSSNRYLGIWYAVDKKTVVWVANRENPITDSSGSLNVTADGRLVIYQRTRPVWTSPLQAAEGTTAPNWAAELLDTGNLVLTAGVGQVIKWQSFDYPSDTMLADMKIRVDLKTGFRSVLTSWTSADDPAPGEYTYMMDAEGPNHNIYLRSTKTHEIIYRPGWWNGFRFSGNPRMEGAPNVFNFTFDRNTTEISYSFAAADPARLQLTPAGKIERSLWDDQSRNWKSYWYKPKDDCDGYNRCGPNGLCTNDMAVVCGCFQGFRPVNSSALANIGRQPGCLRKVELNCDQGEGFLNFSGMKLPDTAANTTVVWNETLSSCGDLCKKNCSCIAYAAGDLRTETGCIMWFGDLIDARRFSGPDINQDNLFLRLPASELAQINKVKKKKRPSLIIIISTSISFIVVIALTICGVYALRMRTFRQFADDIGSYKEHCTKWGEDVPLVDFTTILLATKNFSDENKIGKGGFGCVYKGVLEDGSEVAIKRLSKTSFQGVDEFMNEVILIAKLQHKNLVQLHGCCIQREERILIYEYMPNQSLDKFIFGQHTRQLLDWENRVNIILGIARGLLYLHEDSRLNVIHRDLKAGNILLDGEMNAKISDFGTARIFTPYQNEQNTLRVVGTVGYMSPEYAMDGVFSVKSDVFSFGVILLETISGIKNQKVANTMVQPEGGDESLLASAWRLWREGNSMKLLDKRIQSPYPISQVLRYIHIALLCVQECAEERPTMSSVILMLGSNGSLPVPRQPGMYLRVPTNFEETKYSPGQENTSQETVTLIEGR